MILCKKQELEVLDHLLRKLKKHGLDLSLFSSAKMPIHRISIVGDIIFGHVLNLISVKFSIENISFSYNMIHVTIRLK